MILYLDSSALVKLYVAEPGVKRVRAAVAEAAACCTHLIAYVEVRAALARAFRMQRVTLESLAAHRREFDATWERLDVVVPDTAMVRRAGDLAEHHGLRGYDSVHLAAAAAILERVGGAVPFRMAVFDGDLASAARAIGIDLLD